MIVFRNPLVLLLLIPTIILLTPLIFKVRRSRLVLNKTLYMKYGFTHILFDTLKIALPLLVIIAAATPVSIATIKIPVRSSGEASKYSGELPVQYIILVDVSPSMHRGNYMDEALNTLYSIINSLNSSDRVVIAVFGGVVEEIYSGSIDDLPIINVSRRIRSTEIIYTSIDTALGWANSYSKASNIPAAIIVISDGADNYGADPLTAAETVNESGTPILFIKIGNDPRGLNTYSKLIANGFKVVDPEGLDGETLHSLSKRLVSELRYNAYVAHGKSYIEVKSEDYTPTIILIIAAITVLIAVRIEGR